MALALDAHLKKFLDLHRVARLATVDPRGWPVVLPVCYVRDGQVLYSAIDEKPKRVSAVKLGRLRNIERHPQVSLVIDDYEEDWSRLAYALVWGLAEILVPTGPEHQRAVALLREKYPQYGTMAIEEKPIIKIRPLRVKFWSAV